MALKPASLDYHIRKVLQSKLGPRHLKASAALIDEITYDIIGEIPESAYEPLAAKDAGMLFYHGAVNRKRCEEMQQELMAAHLNLESGKPLQVFLSSPGGVCMYGLGVMGVIHKIQRDGRDVDVHVSGEAASMGSVIAQAGSRRTMDDTALMMLHEVSWDGGHGKLREHEDYLAGCKKLWNSLCRIYASRTSFDADWWANFLERRDPWFTAQECLDLGLIDEIIKSPFAH